MPITDLTGYTWTGNNILGLPTRMTYSLSFTSNNLVYSALSCNRGILNYGNDYVYGNDGWANESYKIIQITGGTDATNSTLIAWLEANGTLTAPSPTPSGVNKLKIGGKTVIKKMIGNKEVLKQVVNGVVVYEKSSGQTDLTNTVWELNSNPNTSTDYEWNIDFSVVRQPESQVPYFANYNKLSIDSYYMYYDSSVAYDGDMWSDNKTIIITGGVDTTNTTLIDWLQNNATQISDLTGTSWSLGIVLGGTYGTYSINFTSNNSTFTNLSWNPNLQNYQLKYNDTNVWDNIMNWTTYNYSSISITGGSDITNINLIIWLVLNATQI